MTQNQAPLPANDVPRSRKKPRRRWRTLLVPLLLLSSLLWVSNWFYQRARLFQGSHVVLGEAFLPWGKVMGEDTARELFGMPVELNPSEQELTWYQIGLIAGFTPLRSLHLRGATDADIRRLNGLINLQGLTLYDSPITDDACDVIGHFSLLTRLDIHHRDGMPAAHITNEGLRSLISLTQLRVLSLQSPDVTDDGLQHIGQLKALTYLALHDAQIKGDSLVELSQLPLLRYLHLQNCPLEGDCLSQLSSSLSLLSLNLYGSTVTDEMLPALIPISTLQNVDLSKTKVTHEGCLALLEARPELRMRDADGQRVER